MHTIAEIERFENVGINCEFGFVQRALGCEAGGLLRWAFCPPASLLKLFEQDFADLFLFENLMPDFDMVRDAAYDIAFHTRMKSDSGGWLHDEDTRRAIHAEEAAKVAHLLDKFRERLQDPAAVFVVKDNQGVPDELRRKLAEAFGTHSAGRLLVVDTTPDPALVGTVIDRGDHVEGLIDRFAPYPESDKFSPAWLEILAAFEHQCPPSSLAEKPYA
ncbi:hypothetical protein GCM10007908_03160 [Rhizobium albus]|nr:hypothetical protein GCM10007908_03160 [Rhizobium albus]